MAWLALVLVLSAASLSAQAQDGYVTVNLNMRAAPASDYPLITTIRAGSPISVRGCIDDYEWCDVVAYGERGWVSGDYIEYDYQNRRVPLYGYGVQFGVPIVSFVIGDYWGSHYSHRSFYRDRDRWYRQPIHYRGSSRHRGDRRDDWRDNRHDSRRDGHRDDRRNDRNDHRSDGRSADRRDSRRDRDDRSDRRGDRNTRTGNLQATEPARQRSAEPRRSESRSVRSADPSPRSDSNRNQRQGGSNVPVQRKQTDQRRGSDSKEQERSKRGDRDNRDENDRKDDDRTRRH